MHEIPTHDMDQNPPERFSPEQILNLRALHARYLEDGDRFSDRERARLQFLRWLYEAKRLDSEPKSEPPRRGDSAGRTQERAEEE